MDRNIEHRTVNDDEFECFQVFDSDTEEILFEQRIRKGIDMMELSTAIFDQFDLDPDKVEEGMEVGLKDVRRELGEDMTSRFRVDEDVE